MGIPDNYKVLFLQGGASSQFAMVPMNLMNEIRQSGLCASPASGLPRRYKEAARYGEAKAVASSREDKTFSYIPELDPSTFTAGRGLLPHLHEQHHLRHQVSHQLPDTGERAAGGGCFLLHSVRAH